MQLRNDFVFLFCSEFLPEAPGFWAVLRFQFIVCWNTIVLSLTSCVYTMLLIFRTVCVTLVPRRNSYSKIMRFHCFYGHRKSSVEESEKNKRTRKFFFKELSEPYKRRVELNPSQNARYQTSYFPVLLLLFLFKDLNSLICMNIILQRVFHLFYTFFFKHVNL